MKIIAFSGKKQSGKTTAARFLILKIDDSIIESFADYLKNIACDCFGATYKDCWEGDKKRILSCGKSVREVLQIIGTDWFRSLDPNCWVNAYQHTLTRYIHSETLAITPDVRFVNEVKCIQDLGGHVIRLLRAPFPDDKHESETALDWTEYMTLNPDNKEPYNAYTFNAVIDNREMTIAEQNEAVWKLVKEKKWI